MVQKLWLYPGDEYDEVRYTIFYFGVCLKLSLINDFLKNYLYKGTPKASSYPSERTTLKSENLRSKDPFSFPTHDFLLHVWGVDLNFVVGSRVCHFQDPRFQSLIRTLYLRIPKLQYLEPSVLPTVLLKTLTKEFYRIPKILSVQMVSVKFLTTLKNIVLNSLLR